MAPESIVSVHSIVPKLFHVLFQSSQSRVSPSRHSTRTHSTRRLNRVTKPHTDPKHPETDHQRSTLLTFHCLI